MTEHTLLHTHLHTLPHALCPVARQVYLQPDAPAIMAGELSWCYRELDGRVEAEASALCNLGLREGDVIMACGRNSPRLIVLILASLRAGIIVLPVNPSFPDACLLAIAADVGITAFWSENDDRCPDWTGLHISTRMPSSGSEQHHFRWDEQRICNLVLTSGSSGLPKAVGHNFHCHRLSAEGSAQRIPLQKGDRWLLSLPLFHIGGLATLFRCLLAGATMVFPDNGNDLVTTLCRRSVSHLSLVNTQLYRLLHSSGENLQQPFDFGCSLVRVILMGGGYVSAELVRLCQQQGVTVMTTYGMTEMSSQICTGVPVFTGSGGVSAGTLLPGSELRIDDDGQIYVRGDMLFRGYWRRGELNLPLDSNGWFATGDRGSWLNDGSIQIAGRVDCQFISGGENIQPESIEKAILALPDIQQAVVVPVVSTEFGFRPVAFIDRIGDFSPEVWQHSLRQQLPGFMVPDLFLSWPEHRAFGLKINRREFMELASQLTTVPDRHGGR